MLFEWSIYITTVLSISTVLTQNISNHKPNFHAGESERELLKKQNDYSLQFDRVELMRFDEKYYKNVKIVTFKYNRTIAVVNASFMPNVDINKEVNIFVQAYKFASNEYRLFPIRFQVNMCDAIAGNMFGIKNSFKCGNFTGCPLKKDIEVVICNWSPDPTRFPPLIPNGQYMLEIQEIFKNSEICSLRAYGSVFRKIQKK